MTRPQMQLGDGLGVLAMLVWLSISVGPWWLGLVIFFVAAVVNFLTRNWQ